MQPKNLIERAYEHARSGDYRNITEVSMALKKEGFENGDIEDHLGGRSMRKELKRICREARSFADQLP